MKRILIAAAVSDGFVAAPSFEACVFRRMKAAESGTRSRIAVQIDPVAQAGRLRPAAPADALPEMAATVVPLTPGRHRGSASRTLPVRARTFAAGCAVPIGGSSPSRAIRRSHSPATMRGTGAITRHAGVPFAGMRADLPKMLSAFAAARGICVTPPMLVSDGCVFVDGRIAASG